MSTQHQSINKGRVIVINIKTGDRRNVREPLLSELLSAGYVKLRDWTDQCNKRRCHHPEACVDEATELNAAWSRIRPHIRTDWLEFSADANELVSIVRKNSSPITVQLPSANQLLNSDYDVQAYLALVELWRAYPITAAAAFKSKYWHLPKPNVSAQLADLMNVCMCLKIWINEKTPLLADPVYSVATKCWWVFHGMTDFPRCRTCNNVLLPGQNVKLSKGYPTFCSISCSNADSDVRSKCAATSIRRFGVKHYALSEKAKQANIEKFGVEYPLQSAEIRAKCKKSLSENPDAYKTAVEKRKKSFLEHYGVDHNMKSEEGRKTWQDAYFKKTGYHHNWSNPDVRESICETNIEKFGVAYATQSPAVLAKVKATNKERRGVDWVFQDSAVKRLISETCMKKYGVPYAAQAEEVKAAIKDSLLESIGYDCIFKSPEKRREIIESFIKKYGVSNPLQVHEFFVKAASKYEFEGRHVDSAPEIIYCIWLRDHGIKFEFQPDVTIEYMFKGVKHYYHPDFLLSETKQLVEIKGDHFFRPDGTMFCPYRGKDMTDEEYDDLCGCMEAKHQCMLEHSVKIIKTSTEEMKSCMKYVDMTYGKGYCKKFKRLTKKSS